MTETDLFAARILIVDDEQANVRLLERLLARAGYVNFLATTDSSAVLRLVAEGMPDLILLDLHMPEPDGFQILQRLQERQNEAFLPILVLTADITAEAKERALSGGAKDFLTKPFDQTEVLLRIRNLLETRFLHLETQRQNVQLEAQLQHAQRMEVIGRLTGGIAHDFNNLLTVINGNAGLLLMDLAEEDQQLGEDLREIKGAAERAAGLTRQLLGFSRQQRPVAAVLDLNQVVTDLQKMFGRLLGGGIRLALDLDAGLGRVAADAGQIQQVVLNLAVNARDAMPAGGTIHFSTRNTVFTEADRQRRPFLVPGRYVQLQVRDSGIGMGEETLARAFTPFFTTKEEGKGTGLGLWIVYGIMKQNRGYVWAESEVGVGTTFTVCLPLVEERPSSCAVNAGTAELHHGSETVLVVEDEEAVRSLIRRILLRSGYRVMEARTAGEALQFCEQYRGRVDLVVADVALPELSGVELADRLLPQRAETRVLLVSGYPRGQGSECESTGKRRAFLRKPFSAESLVHSVRELIDAA